MMAPRMAMLKSVGEKILFVFGHRKWAHAIAAQQPPPLDSHDAVLAPFVLPEVDGDSVNSNHSSNVEYEFPSFASGGVSMELMAVPKRKVSPHKRGIRNGPKALKPVPVIIRYKSCGRVKLPHFYCRSGDRGNTGEPNISSN